MDINLLRIKIETLKNEISDKDKAVISKLEKACNNLVNNELTMQTAIIFKNVHTRLNDMLIDYNLI